MVDSRHPETVWQHSEVNMTSRGLSDTTTVVRYGVVGIWYLWKHTVYTNLSQTNRNTRLAQSANDPVIQRSTCPAKVSQIHQKS